MTVLDEWWLAIREDAHFAYRSLARTDRDRARATGVTRAPKTGPFQHLPWRESHKGG